MRRKLLTLCSFVSLLLCVAVGVLWVRGQEGSDRAEWRYDRYVSDDSAASNRVHMVSERLRPWLSDRAAASSHVRVTSDKRWLWLSVYWAHVGPNGSYNIYDYYGKADESGSRPRFEFRHEPYVPDSPLFGYNDPFLWRASGWGPLRWNSTSRSTPAPPGERIRVIRIGVSHWLAALLLLAPPMLGVSHHHKARRARKFGLCPACGYDLRATPHRCPECGTRAEPAAA